MLNKKENISIASEPSLEYKKEPSKLDRFDSLSFEEKLKEIYASILSGKNEAKENKKTIRKNKRISEEKIFDLQEQLFEIQEKVTVLKNKKQLG